MNKKSIMTTSRQFVDEQLLNRSQVYTSRVLFQILYDLNRSPKSSISVALNLSRFPFDESPITVSMLNIQRPTCHSLATTRDDNHRILLGLLLNFTAMMTSRKWVADRSNCNCSNGLTHLPVNVNVQSQAVHTSNKFN